MTIYIKIPILANNPIYNSKDFVDDYFTTTGEIFVLDNMKEEPGIMQMTGSSRCTEVQAAELKSRWPMMKYYLGFPSSNEWTPKIEG